MKWILVMLASNTFLRGPDHLLRIVNASRHLIGTRIVGGKPVPIKDYRYQLSIVIKQISMPSMTEFRGGAVIVAKRWAITAAHCIEFISPGLITAGMVYMRGNTSHWQTTSDCSDHQILLAEVHSRYDKFTKDFDFALVKVAKPFNAKYESPIKLAGRYYRYKTNSNATVSGWGSFRDDGSAPVNHLRAVAIKLVKAKACKHAYLGSKDTKITKRMLCASATGKDACNFDSGGPLVQRTVLIGVVSWGMACASPLFPGIYSKISQFQNFINDFERKHSTSTGIAFTNKGHR